MTRVIAGEHGGRRLEVPSGATTRPTADRAREALFSSLQSLLDLDGARVLDLYAGSGALGIEALSRGAAQATLVENDPVAAAMIARNVASLRLVGAEIVTADVARFLAGSPRPYELVLLDPPYEADVEAALSAVPAWLAEQGVIVVERRTRDAPLAWPAGLTGLRSRRYGEATLWYGFRS